MVNGNSNVDVDVDVDIDGDDEEECEDWRGKPNVWSQKKGESQSFISEDLFHL